jgi:hypothetical protein
MRRYIYAILCATFALLAACSADDLWIESVFMSPDAGVDAEVQSDADASMPTTPPSFCTIAPPGALCKHEEDPTFVAHCVDGQCVPFGCDYCPKPGCKTLFCYNGQCRQQDEPDGTPCVRTSGPASDFGYVGECAMGFCDGLTECDATTPCPEIPCASLACTNLFCKATFLPVGTQCERADGSQGICSNRACVTPGSLP